MLCILYTLYVIHPHSSETQTRRSNVDFLPLCSLYSFKYQNWQVDTPCPIRSVSLCYELGPWIRPIFCWLFDVRTRFIWLFDVSTENLRKENNPYPHKSAKTESYRKIKNCSKPKSWRMNQILEKWTFLVFFYHLHHTRHLQFPDGDLHRPSVGMAMPPAPTQSPR